MLDTFTLRKAIKRHGDWEGNKMETQKFLLMTADNLVSHADRLLLSHSLLNNSLLSKAQLLIHNYAKP